MYDIVVPVLTFTAVVATGGALLAARAVRARLIDDRLQRSGAAAVDVPVETSWLQGPLGRLGRAVASGGVSRNLREDLARAGYHGEAAPMIYLGAKMLLGAAGLACLMLLVLPLEVRGTLKMPLVLLGTCVLFFLPNTLVTMRRRRRRDEIRAALPDAVDLLEICVSAGMGLDMAWNVVSDEIRQVSPVLADEMALTNLEIHLGAPRVQAMRHLSERTTVQEIGSLVGVLVQSERFGTSIRDALRVFTNSMRETRSAAAQEAAERMSVRLLFPLVLFVFPAIFVVTVGPAVITLVDVFSRR